jgi:DNA-binding beta-propeller fold protein YncE
MKRSREFEIGIACVLVALALGVGSACMDSMAESQTEGAMVAGAGQVPLFEVDPLWPRPLPNHWVMGSTIGLDVDSRGHVWVIHRQATLAANETGAAQSPPTSTCCIPAPPVLEFDAEGNVVGSWGGPGDGYDWPDSNHGITVDHMDNVWIGGNAANDSHILKFTRDGRFLAQYGRPGMRTGSNDRQNFWRVAEIEIDPEANEAYVADGYGNKRVAVLDIATGEMKRYWGAYGNVPDDAPLPPYDPSAPPAQQFRSPMHCAQPSNDRLIYACDRASDRFQVFRPDGTFVTEQFVMPQTLGSGSVWDIAFSHDPAQRFLYVADGVNERVHVLDRESLEILTAFGDGGRQPGQFYGIHNIAVDAQGNIYTTETYEGKRLQKFAFVGYGSAPAYQGTVWPRR